MSDYRQEWLAAKDALANTQRVAEQELAALRATLAQRDEEIELLKAERHGPDLNGECIMEIRRIVKEQCGTESAFADDAVLGGILTLKNEVAALAAKLAAAQTALDEVQWVHMGEDDEPERCPSCWQTRGHGHLSGRVCAFVRAAHDAQRKEGE